MTQWETLLLVTVLGAVIALALVSMRVVGRRAADTGVVLYELTPRTVSLEQAFMAMEEPTRESFMAALMDIQGYAAPFMLEGSTIDTTVDGNPAVSDVSVQKYNGKGYAPAETFGGE